MPTTIIKSGTLGSINAGVSVALGFLFPLGAQIDALIAFGLGPFEADLAVQFDASLALQASLTLSISDPLEGLRLAIQAVVQLQAALQAALSLPPFNISLGAELTASVSLAAALSVKLGNIKLLLEASLAIKIPAMKLATQLQLQLDAGPAFLLKFDGETLAAAGGQIDSMFSGGLTDGPNTISPSDDVMGIILVTKTPAVAAGITFLFGL